MNRFILYIIVCLESISFAAVELSDSRFYEMIPLEEYQVLEDRNYAFETISQESFKDTFVPSDKLDYSCQNTYWLKAELNYAGTNPNFEIHGSFTVSRADIYLQGKGYQGSVGYSVPKKGSSAANRVAPLDITKGTNTMFVRVQCRHGYYPYFRIGNKFSNLHHFLIENIITIAFGLFTLIIGGFTLGIGIFSRNLAFIGYSFYTLSAFLVVLVLYWKTAIIPFQFDVDGLQFAFISAAFLVISMYIFICSLLGMKDRSYIKILFLIGFTYFSTFIIISLFTVIPILLVIGEVIALIMLVTTLAIEIRRKNPIAILLVLSNAPFLILMVIGTTLLAAFGTHISSHYLPLIFLSEGISFSVLLAYEYFQRKTESEKIQVISDEMDLKYKYSDLTTPYLEDIPVKRKGDLEMWINQVKPPWLFTSRKENRIFVVHCKLHQDNIQNMLHGTFLSGVLEAIIYFRKNASEEVILSDLKSALNKLGPKELGDLEPQVLVLDA